MYLFRKDVGLKMRVTNRSQSGSRIVSYDGDIPRRYLPYNTPVHLTMLIPVSIDVPDGTMGLTEGLFGWAYVKL